MPLSFPAIPAMQAYPAPAATAFKIEGYWGFIRISCAAGGKQPVSTQAGQTARSTMPNVQRKRAKSPWTIANLLSQSCRQASLPSISIILDTAFFSAGLSYRNSLLLSLQNLLWTDCIQRIQVPLTILIGNQSNRITSLCSFQNTEMQPLLLSQWFHNRKRPHSDLLHICYFHKESFPGVQHGSQQ